MLIFKSIQIARSEINRIEQNTRVQKRVLAFADLCILYIFATEAYLDANRSETLKLLP